MNHSCMKASAATLPNMRFTLHFRIRHFTDLQDVIWHLPYSSLTIYLFSYLR
jgi:hypothetical protein